MIGATTRLPRPRLPAIALLGGFLVHSRGSSSGWANTSDRAPTVVFTRTDLSAPVLTVNSETETLGPGVPALDYYPVSQADSANFRLWEVPGTSHSDAGLLAASEGAAIGSNTATPASPSAYPVNDGEERYVMDTAISQLNRWVREGVPAVHVPWIDVATSPSPHIVRDRYGNAEGGLRTPVLHVPLATLSGYGNKSTAGVAPGGLVNNACSLFGTTKPFGTGLLRELYPTHADYVTDVATVVSSEVAAGVLLAPDGRQIVRAAEAARVL